MKKKIWNILGYMALSLMVLTACRNGVADVPDVPDLPMETMRLLIAAPEKKTSRAPGDPGSGVDEAEDWDRMAVILAFASFFFFLNSSNDCSFISDASCYASCSTPPNRRPALHPRVPAPDQALAPVWAYASGRATS